MRQSLDRRLTLSVLVTTLIVLSLAFSGLAWLDYQRAKDSIVARVDTLATVTAVNAGVALDQQSSAHARQILDALSREPRVIAAVISDYYGEEFFRYVAPQAQFRGEVSTEVGQTFQARHLDLVRPIESKGETVGTILIRWDTGELHGRFLQFGFLVGGVIFALVLVGIPYSQWVRRTVTRPLNDLVGHSKSIAGGNLSNRVEIVSNDEIGVLARSFNAMTLSLRDLVSQVHHSVTDVTEVARLLESSSHTLASNAQRQDAATSDTTESVDQMGDSIVRVNANVEQLLESMRETSSSIAEMQASISEVAGHMEHLSAAIQTTSAGVKQVASNTNEVVSGASTLTHATNDSLERLGKLAKSVSKVSSNAKASYELSVDASQEAGRGLSAVQETISSMREISSSFHEFEQRISRLAEKSESIDAILRVIRNIVERTTMLSLNASIIAAQAGEHGRAFSVVAEEVNNLARNTQRSTHEIAELIRSVQQETAAAVLAAEEGAAKVEAGVQRSNIAGEVLQVISHKSQYSAERVREILDASSAQALDLESVQQAVNEVNQIGVRFERTARDQQAATSEIAAAIESIRMLGLDVSRSTDEQRRGSALITNAVTDVSGLVSHIAEATQAQTKSNEAIQHALSVFRDVTSETNRSVESINEMVSMLSERAIRLETEIGRFRTE